MNNFEIFRLIHNLSVKEMYCFVGLSRKAIQKIEKNQYTWRESQLVILEVVLGIPRELLFNDDFEFTKALIKDSAYKIAILRMKQSDAFKNFTKEMTFLNLTKATEQLTVKDIGNAFDNILKNIENSNK